MNFGRAYTTLSEDLSKAFPIPEFGRGSSNACPSMEENQVSSSSFLECDINEMRSTIQRLDRESELPALWRLWSSHVIISSPIRCKALTTLRISRIGPRHTQPRSYKAEVIFRQPTEVHPHS